MHLDKIYRHQRKPFLALVLVVTRIRSLTLPHLFPDLNPISLFCKTLHALPPTTSYTAFLAVNVVNYTSANSIVLSSLKIRGRTPRIFRLGKTRAVKVLNSFKNDPLLHVVFAFLFIIAN